ncbi:MAG: phospho-sugar mutase [Pirellulales bacterium]|nr:phospho-sugar mutase [Pirellulales bacterium]
MFDATTALKELENAAAEKLLSPSAVENIRDWLAKPYLADYAPQVAEHLATGKYAQLDDAFWTVIPFGTGGRRGRMYPIGCNAINERTIGESAQGLADYVKEQVRNKPLSCAIAYDTRHRSREFAELCTEIMAAAGYTVYFLDGYRSTPELSFAVRFKKCDCGIMITASHNPPSDNAVKVYWNTGGQLLPPHDADSIAQMQSVTKIERIPFAQAMAAGKIVYCQEEVDAAFIAAVLEQSLPGPRDIKIIYSPLHGVGASAVMPVLKAAGFADVELFAPHAEPNPDFPNVPKHVANPENPAVFDAIIARAKETGAELILATDPDCDRLGCAVPKSFTDRNAWTTLTGNQVGALLTDFLLDEKKKAGTLSPRHYLVKTIVTTELMRRIADDYGVLTAGNLLVGFKYIGGEMDARGPELFVLGAEESYGFLVGDHARDKDAAVASMLLAELAARLKAEGKTLAEKLDELFLRHGCHGESQINVQMPGEKGMEDMLALMAKFRSAPPQSLGGLKLVRMRDYLNSVMRTSDGKKQPLEGDLACPYAGDMVILDLEGGNYVAVRPSGTEPKVKFYLFAFDTPEKSVDLEAVKQLQAERMKKLGEDLRKFSGV